ncbi:hypothetical protein ACTFIT_003263 [Dictyostelium discoideum]
MATKISITRALATVKSMSNGLMLISLTRGTDEFAQEAGFNDSVGAVSDAIKENYQGLQDIIRVHEDILAKVILSNDTTLITVAGKEYSSSSLAAFRPKITDSPVIHSASAKVNAVAIICTADAPLYSSSDETTEAGLTSSWPISIAAITLAYNSCEKRDIVKALKANYESISRHNGNSNFDQRENTARTEAFNGTKKADEASIAVFVNPVIERYQPGVLYPLEISKVIKQ